MVAVSPGARLRRSEILQRKRPRSALPWRTAKPRVDRSPSVLQMASDQLVASTQLCLHRKLRNRRTQSKSINIRKANSISWLKISYIYRPDMSRAQVKGPRDEICLKRPRLSRAKDLKTNALLYLYILILYTLYCF